jgi:hypothetical protein
VKVTGGDGCLLVGGEVFAWRPWEGKGEYAKKGAMINAKGQWEVEEEVWGLLGLVWPKPGEFLQSIFLYVSMKGRAIFPGGEVPKIMWFNKTNLLYVF